MVFSGNERKGRKAYTGKDSGYLVGVGFLTTDNTLIENYPKYHSAVLSAKHQVTKSWLKPTIRIFKNMRNRLNDAGNVKNGIAPSYYLEGLFWNAPDATFGANYNTTVYNFLKWMNEVDESSLLCANAMFSLIGENSPMKWSSGNFRTFRSQVVGLWNDWK